MARVTKNPQERMTEFMNIAEKLFVEHGYQHTMVSDIVKQAKVAQGTFYYYFKTKEDILEALIGRMLQEKLTEIKDILALRYYSSSQKLTIMFQELCGATIDDKRYMLIENLFQDKTFQLFDRLKRKYTQVLFMVVLDMIRQGIEEDSLNVTYPEEVTHAILQVFYTVFESFLSNEREQYSRRVAVFQKVVEYLLDFEPGSFCLAVTLLEKTD